MFQLSDVLHLPCGEAANFQHFVCNRGRTPAVLRRVTHHTHHQRLFGEFDRSLAFSREVFGPASSTTSPDPLNASRRSSHDQAGRGSPEVVPGTSDRGQTLWQDAWRKAEEREEDECPICMCSMIPVSGSNKNNKTERDGAQEKGVLGANQEIRSPPDTEETAAGLLSATRRDRTANAEVVEAGEGRDKAGEGEGRGVPRGRQRTAGDEGGGTTKARRAEKRGTKGGSRRRRQAEVGNQRKKRLLLSCSHVFHKAVSPRGGFAIQRATTRCFGVYKLCPLSPSRFRAVRLQRGPGGSPNATA